MFQALTINDLRVIEAVSAFISGWPEWIPEFDKWSYMQDGEHNFFAETDAPEQEVWDKDMVTAFGKFLVNCEVELCDFWQNVVAEDEEFYTSEVRAKIQEWAESWGFDLTADYYGEEGKALFEKKKANALVIGNEALYRYLASQPEVCQFVAVTNLVPEEWRHWFFEAISTDAPFSWGDNNRTMVTRDRFLDHALKRMEEWEELTENEIEAWKERVEALPEGVYIDLEN